MRLSSAPGIKNGTTAELAVIGSSLSPLRNKTGYTPYKQSLDEVRALRRAIIKPWATRIIQNLIKHTKSQKVHAFNALNTSCDIFHGIDGFFDIFDEKGKRVTITFDVTSNPNKITHKADIVLYFNPNTDELEYDPDAFCRKYKEKCIRSGARSSMRACDIHLSSSARNNMQNATMH